MIVTNATPEATDSTSDVSETTYIPMPKMAAPTSGGTRTVSTASVVDTSRVVVFAVGRDLPPVLGVRDAGILTLVSRPQGAKGGD
jgi:hypothetical protein